MPRKLIWPTHSDLAIRTTPTVQRDEYLDHMTFRRIPNGTPLANYRFYLQKVWEMLSC